MIKESKEIICDINYKVDPKKIQQFKSDFNCLIRAFKNLRKNGVEDINKNKMIFLLDNILDDLKDVNKINQQKQA